MVFSVEGNNGACCGPKIDCCCIDNIDLIGFGLCPHLCLKRNVDVILSFYKEAKLLKNTTKLFKKYQFNSFFLVCQQSQGLQDPNMVFSLQATMMLVVDQRLIA